MTTNFISLDNLRQENFSLMASWLRAVEDLRFSLFPKVKGRFLKKKKKKKKRKSKKRAKKMTNEWTSRNI